MKYFSLILEYIKKRQEENKFKLFLTENKIYFEILNLIVFSLFTIYIWFTANGLIRTQNSIIQIENKPYVYVKSEYMWDKNEEKILNIFNKWWNIYNYKSYILSELKITRKKDMRIFYFNLNFYDTTFWPNYESWILNTKYWYKNNLIYQDFYFSLPKDNEYYYPELNNYVKIQYDDIFWNNHIEYFTEYWEKLDNKKWEEIFNRLKWLEIIYLNDLENFDLDNSDNFLVKYIQSLRKIKN